MAGSGQTFCKQSANNFASRAELRHTNRINEINPSRRVKQNRGCAPTTTGRHRREFITVLLALLALHTGPQTHGADYEPGNLTPPKVEREFRGAWIATVANIDWPSKPGLTTAAQKAELLTLLDRAAQLKLNAVIFQVRPACDAMYASKLEPWSEYLTGTMGKAPSPYYDPLEFAITEAHKRGLELHAWFNPYRAHHPKSWSAISADHISKTRPQLVRKYGSHLWLDPGEREVQDYALAVVMDVVKRYDVDGIHYDDYFYPYAEAGRNGRDIPFPDDASWKKFGAGGKLSRDDWRRENVNMFIERTYRSIKTEKPWVKFGVSPFGIWRPGYPAQIKGLDAYASLYADARKWLMNGWLDYCAPQLYWARAPKEQSFPVLLDWWNDQNPKRRHIWPGLDTTKVPRKWNPEEIVGQIRLTEKQPVSAGHIHWNLKSLLRSSEMQAALVRGPYAEPALIPASPWLTASAPPKPKLNATVGGTTSVKLSWENNTPEKIGRWLLQYQRAGKWNTQLLPGDQSSVILDGPLPDALALTAVNRTGDPSPPAAVRLKTP